MKLWTDLPSDFPWATVQDKADFYGLDPLLVAAVCLQESRCNTWANRVEFKRLEGGTWRNRWRYLFRPAAFAKALLASNATERINQSTSFGLMQCMGAVAREKGFKGWLTELCKPSVGLEYGCRHLRYHIDRWGSIERGLQGYNAGSPGSVAGRYYSKKVMGRWKKLKTEKERLRVNQERGPGSTPGQKNSN